MKEYIEREAAKKEFLHAPMTEDEKILVIRRIYAIPAADVVEVRHGRWDERIVDNDEFDKYGFFRRRFYCSACGDWNTHGASKYCPHCGARMDGGADK